MTTVQGLISFLLVTAAVPGTKAGSDVEIAGRREAQYFPALNYGYNRWTSVRLENHSSVPRSVEIEAYRDDGSPMEVASPITLGPREKTDIRLAGAGKALRWCWARITKIIAAGESAEMVSITVTIEMLKGNHVEQFERKGVTPASFGNHRWINRSSDAQGKQLYYLNTSSSAAVLTFCQAPNTQANCERVKPKFGVNGRGSILLNVRRLLQPYAIAETSDDHGGGMLLYLSRGSGKMTTFGAESSITFGSEVK
jgi:hypothetical protein